MFDETDVQQFMRFYCRKKRLYRKKTKTKTIDLFERKFNTTAKTAKKKFCSYISTDVLHWFHCKKRKLFGFKKSGKHFFSICCKKNFFSKPEFRFSFGVNRVFLLVPPFSFSFLFLCVFVFGCHSCVFVWVWVCVCNVRVWLVNYTFHILLYVTTFKKSKNKFSKALKLSNKKLGKPSNNHLNQEKEKN